VALLETTERSLVEKALIDVLVPQGPLLAHTWLTDRITDDRYKSDLGARVAITDLVKHALTLALAQQGQKYPTVLLEILNELAQTGNPAILAIENSVQTKLAALAPIAASPNPQNCLLDNLLTGNFPFINRTILRSKLTSLLNPHGAPLFVVNGQPGSGRSYSRNLIEHCYVRANPFQHVPIVPQLDPQLAKEALPEDLAVEIVNGMGLEPNRQSLPARDRSVTINQYGKRLAIWLLEHIKADDENVYWIVLDGYGCDELYDWTRSFISSLAVKITVGLYRQKVKLILLNYPRTKLEAVEDHCDEEVIQTVTVGDLRAYLGWWYHSKGEPFTAEDVTKTINILLATPPSSDNDPLTAAQLKTVSKALKEMASA
jgi:hypothetical protein